MKIIALLTLFILGNSNAFSREGKKKALALTTSGGVSLGSYQSGLSYFSNQVVKFTQGHEFKLFTGASAGGINSFLTLLDSCAIEQSTPRSSIFWRSWIPLGIKTLYIPEKVGKYNLLSREQVEKILDLMEDQWRKGLRTDCEVVLSLSVTRANKYELPIVERLSVPRLAESFILKIKGRGAGIVPVIENYPFPDEKRIRLLLPFKYGGANEEKDNFAIMRELLSATAAFPLAFAPVPISYCIKRPLEKGTLCADEDVRTDKFIDGGVFDNGPIRMAFNLVANGLEYRSGHWNWRKNRKKVVGLPQDIQFAFVDTNLKEFPTLRDELSTKVDGIFDFLYRFLYQFITTARTKELASLIEEYPRYSSILATTKNYLPLASEPLLSFNGFFEEDFRKFDFYVGMYDSYRHLIPFDKRGGIKKFILEQRPKQEWLPLLCIISKFEKSISPKNPCDQIDDGNFKKLLNVSLDRLAYHCSLKEKMTYKSCHHFERDPVTEIEYKNDFQYFMELLDYHKFQFKDLDEARENPSYGVVQIENILTEMNGKLAQQQPTGQGFALQTIFKPALNYIKYTPSPSTAYLSLGSGIEAGFSHSLHNGVGFLGRIRLHGSLLYQGADTLFGGSRTISTVSPMLGFEYESYYLSNEFTQYQFGAKGGYLLSSGDDFGANPCDPLRSENISYACSQWVVGPTASVTLLERLKLHLFGQFYPRRRSGSKSFQLLFFFGYQFLDIF